MAAGDTSKKYDQAFFLVLAAKGKDAWNAWLRDPANKDVRVTFAGIDFSQAPRDQIEFVGFEFGCGADFSGCKWRSAESVLAIMPDGMRGGADFNGAAFGDGANFTGAAFGTRAYFTGAAFGDGANFTSAAFGYWAMFTGAAFGDEANFTGATFGDGAWFRDASFGDGANFTGAAFGAHADFGQTRFRGRVEFTGQSEEQWTRGLASVSGMAAGARWEVERRHKESWARLDSGPDRFSTISFANAHFDGEAVFAGRSFARIANFTATRFCYPPDFDGVTHVARIDFTGVHIGFVPPGKRHWTFETEVPIRLRAFRKIVEETKNHDLARDLYIEERKAERGVYGRQLLDELTKATEELQKKLEDINKQKRDAWSEWRLQVRARNAHRLGIAVKIARLFTHFLWIAVMGVYWALADYGRNFVRPLAWLISSVFIFYWGYSHILAPLKRAAGSINAGKYDHAVRMLALGNAVPCVGPLTIDGEVKKFLFCPGGDANCLPVPPEGYQSLVLGQNLLSITLVFFIGLALRNYFKIKRGPFKGLSQKLPWNLSPHAEEGP
ncbi:MAG: pentapeptide repeat-containing protein [Methylocella sp.]